ncbi:single-strand DNA-binding protein [Nocardioides cavernae]|uniref:single-stranded DNA-binding protein n=1 Tax=Nocardioides cavernae TaxID=1921566 RepID=UPI0027DD920B|nr:single-stranded DNA-binding protein [Nocardioides cavernae]MBM7513179.1 single-strand DNA-binding protein [Nocardioides cavernae]
MTTSGTTTDTKKTATARKRRSPDRSPRERRAQPPADDGDEGANEVRLVGRLTSVPVVVELPSGDALVSFRVSVPRSPGATKTVATTSQRVDSIPCSAWTASLRRRIAGWRPGDTVEVAGAVCCRFYQAGGATRSRVEVVASSARIIRRSPVA